MNLFGTLARMRRGEMNLFLLTALVLLLAVPSSAHAAVLPPQGCEAVILWLQNESAVGGPLRVRTGTSLLALTHRDSRDVYSPNPAPHERPLVSERPLTLAVPRQPQQWHWKQGTTNSRGFHALAAANGIRTNRRLH